MKLLVAFVQESDADRVAEALRRDGHRFTRVASTGGFLETPTYARAGLLAEVGTDDTRLAPRGRECVEAWAREAEGVAGRRWYHSAPCAGSCSSRGRSSSLTPSSSPR